MSALERRRADVVTRDGKGNALVRAVAAVPRSLALAGNAVRLDMQITELKAEAEIRQYRLDNERLRR